jgi:hypothetical protein
MAIQREAVTVYWKFKDQWVLIPTNELPDKLNEHMEYKIKVVSKSFEMRFKGKLWDKSILDGGTNLAYWLGVNGCDQIPWTYGFDIMSFHNGVADRMGNG